MSYATPRETALEALQALSNDVSLEEITQQLSKLEQQKVIPYPAAQKLEPRLPTIKPRNRKLVSTGIRELRDERENSL